MASALTTIARLTIIIVAVVVLKWGIWGVLWGALVANVGSGCILSLREFSRSGFRPDVSTLLPVIRFAWPFVPGGLIGFALFSGDRYFLLKSAGSEAVGVYAVGARLASVVTTVSFSPLFQVWSASMYQVYRELDGARVVGQMFTRLLTPSVFVGLMVFLFRSEIIQFLASPEYAGSASVIGPLILSSWMITAQVLGDGPFYVYRRSRTKLCVTIVSTVIAVTLFAVLIPRYHIWGATLAVVLSSTIYAMVTLITAQTVFRVQYEWGRLSAIAGITIALAISSYAVHPGISGMAIKLAIAAVWPVSMWYLNVINQREKAMVVQAVSRVYHSLRKAGPAREPEDQGR